MSINIENNLKVGDSSSLGIVHYLPCEIQGDGEANVKQFFEPYIKKVGDGTLTASFRGRPLQGSTFTLPPGHCLTLITEAKTPLGKSHRNFKVKGRVFDNEITYWNWDVRPSQNDALHKASKWMTLAAALHDPLVLEKK